MYFTGFWSRDAKQITKESWEGRNNDLQPPQGKNLSTSITSSPGAVYFFKHFCSSIWEQVPVVVSQSVLDSWTASINQIILASKETEIWERRFRGTSEFKWPKCTHARTHARAHACQPALLCMINVCMFHIPVLERITEAESIKYLEARPQKLRLSWILSRSDAIFGLKKQLTPLLSQWTWKRDTAITICFQLRGLFVEIICHILTLRRAYSLKMCYVSDWKVKGDFSLYNLYSRGQTHGCY